MRVSLPGYNVLTDTNLDHYALFTDADNVLIKEKARGTFNASAGSTVEVSHNLGYIPYVQAYVDVGSQKYTASGFTNTAVTTTVHVDTTKLYLVNDGTAAQSGTYFIFYDNQV